MSQENITDKQPLIRYVNRQQMSWRAVDVERLISEDHPARAIWTLVGRLDLSPFYRAIESSVEEGGRPAFDPQLLISLWVYAYSQGIGSAREVARRCEYDPAFQWLTGLTEVNYHTLADFRVEKQQELDELFTQVLAAQRWEELPADVKSFATHPTEFSLEFDDFELLSEKPSPSLSVPLSNFDDGTPRTSTGGSWSYVWADAPNSALELIFPGRNGSAYAGRVAGTLDGTSSSELLASFHADGAPADLRAYSGIRFWVRGNGMLQVQLLQPSISDWDNYSIDSVRVADEWKQITVSFKDLKQAGWGVAKPFTPESLSGIRIVSMTPAGDPDRPPSGLYEGMITPLKNVRIRGAIWYQGEGNTWRAYQYRTLLPALIRGWRQAWGEGDFPFLIVQLPNQGSSTELGDSIWAELREAQLFTARSVANTGLAVTIDVGDAKNLHPPRKAEVGQRLAAWALGTTYGKKIEYSGPLYDSMKISGDAIRIKFKHIGAGLEAHDGQLKGFAIAGADRKFHWAEARIEGESVVVSSAEVNVPVAVRYAWAESPECNLYNKGGLPASPFRTDDWPGATYEKR